MTTSLALSRIHYPVDVLGPGRRVGIWLQGCTIGCPGCLSRDTWDPQAGRITPVTDVVQVVLSMTDGQGVSGVTISGGEPFEQPAALAELLKLLIPALEATRESEVDVLVYSGFGFTTLIDQHSQVLELIDAIIPEPYRAVDSPGGLWRGSANQPLVLLSDLARERYDHHDAGSRAGPSMQVAVDDAGVWMIGVPGPGALRRLEAELAERGVVLSNTSWRP